MPRVKYITPLETPACDLKDQYYTTRELSEILGLAMSTLAEYRRKGIGPKYIAVGYRSYRYPRSEILAFIEEQTCASTSANRNYDYNPKGQKGD